MTMKLFRRMFSPASHAADGGIRGFGSLLLLILILWAVLPNLSLAMPLPLPGTCLPAHAEEGGRGDGNGQYDVTDWVRVHAVPVYPPHPEIHQVVVSVEIYDSGNGSWRKEWNGTVGELVRKPESPQPEVIDRQNGTMDGIILGATEPGPYRVWAGVLRENRTHWNFTDITIEPRNRPPVPVALLGRENGTAWSTLLEVWIPPGEAFTVYLNGSLSHDPDGDPLEHFWDVDGRAPTDDLAGPWGNWTFSSAGEYPITLTVGDGHLYRETTVLLRIHDDVHPDLMISLPPALSEGNFASGQPVNITAQIRNRGAVPAGPFSIFVYDHDLSRRQSQIIHIRQITGLEPGEQFTLAFTWNTTHLAQPGYHVLRAHVDPLNSVEEMNTTNNMGWSDPFMVEPAVVEQPFVTIKGVSVSNETPYLHTMVNITLTMANTGGGNAEMLTVILQANGEDYVTHYVPIIEAGEEGVLVLRYYADLKGTYNLTCLVYHRGLLVGSEGRRIIIMEPPRHPTVPDDPNVEPEETSQNLDRLMFAAGVFMIIIAIAIQIVGRKVREK